MGGGKLSNNETKNSLVPRNLKLNNKEMKSLLTNAIRYKRKYENS
jgi:hypothetical protein